MKFLGLVLVLNSLIIASGLPGVVRMIGVDDELKINDFAISNSFDLAPNNLDSDQSLSFTSYYKSLPQVEPFGESSQVTELLWWQNLGFGDYEISLGRINSQVSYGDSMINFFHDTGEFFLKSSANVYDLLADELGLQIEVEEYAQSLEFNSKWSWNTELGDVVFEPFVEYSQFNNIESVQIKKYNLELQSIGAFGLLGGDLSLSLGKFNFWVGAKGGQSLTPKSEVLADLLSQNSWECKSVNCIGLKKEFQNLSGVVGVKLFREFLLSWDYRTTQVAVEVQNTDKSKPFSETNINYLNQKIELLSRSLGQGVLTELGLSFQSLAIKQYPSEKEFVLASEFFPVEGGEVVFSLFQKERWRSLSSLEYVGIGIPIRLRCLPSSWENKGYFLAAELNPFLDLFQYKTYLENQKVLSLLFTSTEVQRDESSPLWAIYGFHPKLEFGYQSKYGALSVYLSQYLPVYYDVWKGRQYFSSERPNQNEDEFESSSGSGGTKFGFRYTVGI